MTVKNGKNEDMSLATDRYYAYYVQNSVLYLIRTQVHGSGSELDSALAEMAHPSIMEECLRTLRKIFHSIKSVLSNALPRLGHGQEILRLQRFVQEY